jgi:hypothetical protein
MFQGVKRGRAECRPERANYAGKRAISQRSVRKVSVVDKLDIGLVIQQDPTNAKVRTEASIS